MILDAKTFAEVAEAKRTSKGGVQDVVDLALLGKTTSMPLRRVAELPANGFHSKVQRRTLVREVAGS